MDGTSKMLESVGSIKDLSMDKLLNTESEEYLTNSNRESSIYCRPLSFENFFIRCKEKLN